jgi:DNA-binding NarL/FixJ family response regulator
VGALRFVAAPPSLAVVHVIVAAIDPEAREVLRARVLRAGLPCDEDLHSSAMLERSLELRDPANPTIVVVAQDEEETLAHLALGRGVPVLVWPSRGMPNRTGPAAIGLRRIEPDLVGRDVARPIPLKPSSYTGPSRRLTAREVEILALVAAGTSNKGIARSLRISPNTVKFHMTTLFGKLGVTTRAEAIAAAARSGELAL